MIEPTLVFYLIDYNSDSNLYFINKQLKGEKFESLDDILEAEPIGGGVIKQERYLFNKFYPINHKCIVYDKEWMSDRHEWEPIVYYELIRLGYDKSIIPDLTKKVVKKALAIKSSSNKTFLGAALADNKKRDILLGAALITICRSEDTKQCPVNLSKQYVCKGMHFLKQLGIDTTYKHDELYANTINKLGDRISLSSELINECLSLYDSVKKLHNNAVTLATSVFYQVLENHKLINQNKVPKEMMPSFYTKEDIDKIIACHRQVADKNRYVYSKTEIARIAGITTVTITNLLKGKCAKIKELIKD